MKKIGKTLTTSIAYGDFVYIESMEFAGIEKNRIHGTSYLSAFLDSESGKPKIKPGLCRITTENGLDKIKNIVDQNRNEDPFNYIREKDDKYYYWMVNSPDDIDPFIEEYNDAYENRYEKNNAGYK
jgi:hypothetical protein